MRPRGTRADAPAVVGPLDLEIAPGERIALLGPNGAGKSTLLQALAGLAPVVRGDREVPAGGAVRLVLQNPDNQFLTVSVERELALGPEFLGVAPAAVRARVEAAIEGFGLEPLRARPPHRLSGGEKQRVAIAAMMALEPRLLLLDEPASYLDARGRAQLERALASLRTGIAVLRACSHAGEALGASRALVMHGGTVVADAPARELLSDRALLGSHGLEAPALVGLAGELERHGMAVAAGAASRFDPDAMAEAIAARASSERPGRGAAVPGEGAGAPRERAVAAAGEGAARGEEAGCLRGEDVHFEYAGRAGRPALRGASLSVRRGEVTALLGGSGAGKSTLLAVLAGLERPDRGAVHGGGRVAVLFQFAEDQVIADTVLDDVAWGPRREGRSEGEARRVASETLHALGLDASRQSMPMEHLSHGERRLVALAGVLALRPDYLLLDEPTAGLDHAARVAVTTAIEGLAAAGAGVLLATHDLELAASIAPRAVVLSDGAVLRDDRFGAILQDDGLMEHAALVMPPLASVLRALRARGHEVPWPERLTARGAAEAIARGPARVPRRARPAISPAS